MEQHRRGYKSARLVKRFALRLRPDLYEDLPAFPGSKTACRAELERAHELAGCGFVAHCDGTSYGKEEADWAEWDAERLEPIGHLVDEAAKELYESSFRPLNAERCARPPPRGTRLLGPRVRRPARSAARLWPLRARAARRAAEHASPSWRPPGSTPDSGA